MSLLLKLIAVAIGVFMIFRVMRTMRKRKLSEAQSILWLLSAAVLVLLSIFPEIIAWGADILGVWWAPAILIFAVLVLFGFILFDHAEQVSMLHAQVMELSMQVGLLRHELEMKNNEIEEIKKETEEQA